MAEIRLELRPKMFIRIYLLFKTCLVSLKFLSLPFVNGYLLPKQEDKLFFNVSCSRIHEYTGTLPTVSGADKLKEPEMYTIANRHTIYQCSKLSGAKCEIVTNELPNLIAKQEVSAGKLHTRMVKHLVTCLPK